MGRTYSAVKTSFTLSQSAVTAADHLAGRFANGNASLIVDVAVKSLATLQPVELERLIRRERAERSVAGTREIWMRTFWQWLAGLFDKVDSIDNPYAARIWDGYYVVFLLKSTTEYPAEGDPFFLHAAAQQWTPQTKRFDRDVPRDQSPVEAAESVAAWIQAQAAASGSKS